MFCLDRVCNFLCGSEVPPPERVAESVPVAPVIPPGYQEVISKQMMDICSLPSKTYIYSWVRDLDDRPVDLASEGSSKITVETLKAHSFSARSLAFSNPEFFDRVDVHVAMNDPIKESSLKQLLEYARTLRGDHGESPFRIGVLEEMEKWIVEVLGKEDPEESLRIALLNMPKVTLSRGRLLSCITRPGYGDNVSFGLLDLIKQAKSREYELDPKAFVRLFYDCFSEFLLVDN